MWSLLLLRASAKDVRRKATCRSHSPRVWESSKPTQLLRTMKLDRDFRSVKHMHDTLAAWEVVGVAFRSITNQFDTSTAMGRLLLNLLAALAEFELEVIRERVKSGMERARRQGHKIGRPSVWDRRGFSRRFGDILERLNTGDVSRRQAALELGIGYATLKRLLDARDVNPEEHGV